MTIYQNMVNGFFPIELAAELKDMDKRDPSMESAFGVYKAYAIHTQFSHMIFFPSILEFSRKSFIRRLDWLKPTGMFTGEDEKFNKNMLPMC